MLRFSALLFLLFSLSFAQLKVVATYPWIGEIVKEIGKDRVKIHTIAKPTEDFHFVVPRPSHIAKLRSADLVVINGAGLEVGFLPPLLQQSNNPRIQPGRAGFLDLSQFVQIIEKPEKVSREMGDVHSEGNPHFHLDPHNIPLLARAVTDRMCQLNPQGCDYYRANLQDFLTKWEKKLAEWDAGFSKLKGLMVVQYHRTYNYLFRRYGIETLETIEPLPGIPPTAKHLDQLIKASKEKGVRFIILEAFRAGDKNGERIARATGAKLVILPQDVNVEGVKDLFGLFDEILRRLSE